MEYGLIHLAIVPLREEPAHRAQQVSQLLFGEGFLVLEKQDQWIKIQTENEGYTGWMQATQGTLITNNEYGQHQQKPVWLTHEPVTVVKKNGQNTFLYLPAGSRIAGIDQREFMIGTLSFQIQNEITRYKSNFISYAHTFLNAPYLWGGRTHFGIDCSGFVQAVFRQNGLQLQRDAWQQAEQGTTVDFLQAALPGDLAFFDNEAGRIIHVGMMLNQEQIIHSAGNVKIDRIDDQGIYSADQKKYTHHLRIIKRYLS